MIKIIIFFVCCCCLTAVVKTNNWEGENMFSKTPTEIDKRIKFEERIESTNFEVTKAARTPGRTPGIPFLPNNITRTRIRRAPYSSASYNLAELINYFSTLKSGLGRFPLRGTTDTKDCKTHDAKDGSCILITECKTVMDTYRQRTPKICRWNNQLPVVCCPDSSMSRRKDTVVCGIRAASGTNRNSNPSPKILRIGRSKPQGNNKDKNPVIVGGRNSTNGAWPWMAGIYFDHFRESFRCGSTIINERYLVTAAHCFEQVKLVSSIPAGRFSIRVGSVNKGGGDKYQIDSITLYPGYDQRQHYKDIAIIRLKEPLQFNRNVRPICLPTRQGFQDRKLERRNVTVTGWGAIEFGNRDSPVLKEVTVQVRGTEMCDQSYKGIRGTRLPQGVTNEFICAGTREGGKDSCPNDSGGPLMLLENGVYFLVGVVSFGFQCGRTSHPGVYSRMTSYLDWVEKITSRL